MVLRTLGSIGVVFELWGSQTNGSVFVEHPFPVGALVPAHPHTREDEYSIVTKGEIGFRSGDREVALGLGGYINQAARRDAHDVERRHCPGTDDRGLSPAGFENFSHEFLNYRSPTRRISQKSPRCEI